MVARRNRLMVVAVVSVLGMWATVLYAKPLPTDSRGLTGKPEKDATLVNRKPSGGKQKVHVQRSAGVKHGRHSAAAPLQHRGETRTRIGDRAHTLTGHSSSVLKPKSSNKRAVSALGGHALVGKQQPLRRNNRTAHSAVGHKSTRHSNGSHKIQPSARTERSHVGGKPVRALPDTFHGQFRPTRNATPEVKDARPLQDDEGT